MPSLLSRLATGTLGKGSLNKSIQPVPICPVERRPLTPDLSNGDRSSIGPFFDELPFELRRNILVEAFGNLPVHIGFELSPEWSEPVLEMAPKAGRRSAMSQSKSSISSAYAGRQWRNCVCKRNTWHTFKNDPLCRDQCFKDLFSSECEDEIPQTPLGAMGWILTCRQAYVEGIEVLYSTNMFVMTSDDRDSHMVQEFCYVTPPQRLASISKLELTWHVNKPRGFDPRKKPFDWPQNVDLPFGLIQSTFPRLKTLQVSLHGEMLYTEESTIASPRIQRIVKVKEDAVFNAADAMAKSLDSQLEELYVSINWTLWNQLVNRDCRKDGFLYKGLDYPGARFWRPLGDGPHMEGYWVVEGSMDGRSMRYLPSTLH